MNIQIEITERTIESVLYSAFHTGIGYWARIVDYTECERMEEAVLAPDSFVQIEIRPQLRDGLGRDVVITKPLNRETIAAGLRLMAATYPRHFADMLGGNMNCDATTGDVLVQLAVFGKIVFG